MQIYDGSTDKKAFPTTHTAAVVSADRVRCGTTDQMTIRKRGREDWSLFYCEAGRLCFAEGDVTAGQLWIYPPRVPQKYAMYRENQTVYRYLHFTGSDVARILESLGIELQTPITVSGCHLSETFDHIQRSIAEDSPRARLKAEYHTLHLIWQIAQNRQQNAEGNLMKRITDKMEHSFALPYDAAAYAEMLHMSVSRFNHLFKDCVGLPPYAYYLKLRIDNAACLLEDTTLKIGEIASQCGFGDPVYFTQAFKRARGCTPSEYRKTVRPR